MEENRRITLADIAQKLGLTKMSVARALKGGRGVSEVTRAKVKTLAESMGYVPDPSISMAMARMRSRKPADKDTIAWLSSHGASGAWRDNYIVEQLYRGAEAQAARMGFRIEEFCVNEKGMSAKRMGSILYNRGVRGVIVAPLREHGKIPGFPWMHFAVVCCGHSLVEPHLHRVVTDQFEVVQVAWRALLDRGYKRIGLVVSATDNNRVNNLWLSAHLGCQRTLTPDQSMGPMVTDDWNAEVFLKWFEKNQPDAIISFPEVHGWMKQSKSKAAAKCGFALLNFDEGKRLAGVDHRFAHSGAAAVSLVASEIGANQFGIPEVRKSLSIECRWRDAPSPVRAK